MITDDLHFGDAETAAWHGNGDAETAGAVLVQNTPRITAAWHGIGDAEINTLCVVSNTEYAIIHLISMSTEDVFLLTSNTRLREYIIQAGNSTLKFQCHVTVLGRT